MEAAQSGPKWQSKFMNSLGNSLEAYNGGSIGRPTSGNEAFNVKLNTTFATLISDGRCYQLLGVRITRQWRAMEMWRRVVFIVFMVQHRRIMTRLATLLPCWHHHDHLKVVARSSGASITVTPSCHLHSLIPIWQWKHHKSFVERTIIAFKVLLLLPNQKQQSLPKTQLSEKEVSEIPFGTTHLLPEFPVLVHGEFKEAVSYFDNFKPIVTLSWSHLHCCHRICITGTFEIMRNTTRETSCEMCNAVYPNNQQMKEVEDVIQPNKNNSTSTQQCGLKQWKCL